MKDLRDFEGIEFGSWLGQGKGHSKSYKISDATAEKIESAIAAGKKVVVGNAPHGKGELLSRVNSRYHGKSIRTIRALSRSDLEVRRIGFSAVVETGSCSPDYRRWEERATCGHLHRTIKSAEKCLEKLTRWYCDHGRVQGTPCRHCLGGIAQGKHTSALWYNGRIHNQDGERV